MMINLSPIRDDYIRKIMEITELARSGQKVKRKRDRNAPYSPDNDMDVYLQAVSTAIHYQQGRYSIYQ